MGNINKMLLIIGPVVLSFSWALTSPIINLYFIKLVSAEVYAISNLLSICIAALVNSVTSNDNIRAKLKHMFILIVLSDSFAFIAITSFSVDYPNFRFISLAIINALSTTLWIILMRDAINNVIGGDTLTKWQSFSRSFELWASFIGAGLAIVFTNIDIEIAIWIQCMANFFMGITDIIAFRRLNDGIVKKECI